MSTVRSKPRKNCTFKSLKTKKKNFGVVFSNALLALCSSAKFQNFNGNDPCAKIVKVVSTKCLIFHLVDPLYSWVYGQAIR